MSSFPLFVCSMRNEKAKTAMENYVRILQQAFVLYQDLWEDYIKLQEKYEQSNTHASSQSKADEPCERRSTKKSTPQRDTSGCAFVQGNDSVPLLELDTLNISYAGLSPNTPTSFSGSSRSQPRDNDSDNLSRSPVFSKSRLRADGTSARRSLQLSKAKSERSKVTPDPRTRHNADEQAFQARCNKRLAINTTHHVETTFLPDGKRMKQSRLVLQPVKRTVKRKELSPDVKSVDVSLNTTQDSVREITAAETVSLNTYSNTPSADDALEDVIEISPTQRNIRSRVRHCLRLKRKIPVKQAGRDSPDKSVRYNALQTITIMDTDTASPISKRAVPAMTEDDESTTADSPVNNTLRNKINASDSSSVKVFNKERDVQITKPVKDQKRQQPTMGEVSGIKTPDVNESAYEDETFYSPAEQVANRHDVNDFEFCLNDTENQPPAKTILLDKPDAAPKRRDVPKQLNMRCRADRAKLNGWGCWECEQYYENLALSKEELQKRKNQCSRHRHKYKRPRTPEGFWDLGFPETMSSTYRQTKN